MGAHMSGLGTSTITIEGVDSLHGTRHAVLPDRIETGTYAMAAAICGGEIELTGTSPDLIEALVPLLKATGTTVAPSNLGISVYRAATRPTAADRVHFLFPSIALNHRERCRLSLILAEVNRLFEFTKLGHNARPEGRETVLLDGIVDR